MKVSEAEKLVCPFMSIGFAADTNNLRSGGLIECNCITTKCMAWVITDDWNKQRPQDCEGYCQRIKDE